MHDLIQVAVFTAFFKCPAALLYALIAPSCCLSCTEMSKKRDVQSSQNCSVTGVYWFTVLYYDCKCQISLRFAQIFVTRTVYFYSTFVE